jgi:TonB family protein
MRLKLLLIIIASVAGHHATFAPAAAGVTQEPANKPPTVSRKTTPEQNAELLESQKMSLEVVKLYNREKYDEALPLATRAVEITERILGAEDPHLATALRNLAELYVAKRKYQQAEPLFLRAIAIDDLTQELAGNASGVSTIDRYICLLYQTRSINEALKAEREFFEKRKKPKPPQSVEDLKGGSLTGGVLNGRAISLAQPAYPAEAKRMGAIGIVRIQVLIDETGKVIEAKVLCGHPIFARPALESAYKSRFTPTKLSGMAVKVNGIIVYNFQ